MMRHRIVAHLVHTHDQPMVKSEYAQTSMHDHGMPLDGLDCATGFFIRDKILRFMFSSGKSGLPLSRLMLNLRQFT